MTTYNATQQLIKSYSDKTYKYTTTINHRGTVVAFAMDDQRRVHYAVLDMGRADAKKGELDVNYWPEDPKELRFPGEIEQVGYSITGATAMPLVKKGGRLEAKPGTLRPEEIDGFLSTTARLTGDAPFQVFSDNKHIFVFRQSLPVDHADMVHKLQTGGASGDSARPEDEFVLHEGARVPLVDNTLLCDRFILAGAKLQSKLEVRYRRSRHKTRAAGATDSLGAKDMEGRPFFEPTQELAFIKNLQQGRFSVLQLPTEVSSVKRWQIFSHNSASNQIDSFNLAVSGDGLFNPAGTQLYTSPDAQYQNAVLEREPGNCPFTGLPLIPVVSERGFAESCLSLDGKGHVKADIETWNAEAFTLELWVKPAHTNQAKSTGLFASMQGADANSFQIDFDSEGNYRFNHTEKAVEIGPAKTDWQHLAVSYDGKTLRTYLDGDTTHESEVSLTALFKTFTLGINRGGDRLFSGCIDEVRVWDYARYAIDIQANKNRRLIGDEPSLKTYYRFDEGSGKHLSDQTGNGHDGAVQGEANWVASNAPIGDHPSVRRSSFALVAEQTDPIEITQPAPPPAPAKTQKQIITTTETIQESFTSQCLSFDGSNYVEIPHNQSLSTNKFTVSLWAKVTGGQSHRSPITFRDDYPQRGFILYATNSWSLIIGKGKGWESIGGPDVKLNQWVHLAATHNGSRMELFVDGISVGAKAVVMSPNTQRPLRIGAGGTEGPARYHFQGDIAEVQLWNTVHNQEEIQANMHRRLVGDETGLLAYYTFDEGSGNIATDQSGHGHQGTLQGNPNWRQAGISLEREVEILKEEVIEVPAEAEEVEPPPPLVIDHSGARTLVGGLSARLYYQQEATATGYDGQSKPMKKNARVMLAAPTIATGQPESAALATVDFAVSRQGRLAQIPDALTLPVLHRPENAGDASAISQLEGTIRGLNQDIERLSDEIARARAAIAGKGSLQTQKQNLETELPNLRTQLTNARNNPRNYWFRLQIKANGKYFMQNPNHKDRIIQTSSVSNADEFKFESYRSYYNQYLLHRRLGMDMWVHNDDYLGLSDGFIQSRIIIVTFHDNDYVSLKGGYDYAEDRTISASTGSHHITRTNNPSHNYDKFHLIKTDPCNNTVSNLESRISSKQKTLVTVTAQLNQMQAEEVVLRQKEADMVDKQNLLLNKRSELNLLSGGGQGEISLPMRHTHSDPAGLTVSGALLAFARSADTPLLFDSANGKLTTYYRSPEGQLLAGYLDINVARARFEIARGNDRILFLARSAGSHPDEISIAIVPGNSADTCTLTIANPGLELTEVWQDLPRNPRDFAAIVNGQTKLPEGVTASVTPITYSLAQGSTQLVVLPQDNATIFNGTATRSIRGVNCQWIADAPGQAYHFDGDKHRLTATDELDRFAPEANLTIESWANPSVANRSVRLLHYNGQKSAYFLGLQQAESQTGFAFDGNDQISYPLPEDLLDFNRSFTLECWVYFGAMEKWKYVFHVSKDSKNFMQLLTNSSSENKLQLTIQQAGAVYQKASNFLPQLETWYHVACVWDAENQHCQLLIDGDEQIYSGVGNPTGVNQIGFSIGARINGNSGMQGHVDEVRLWNYARTQGDVQLGQYRRAYRDEAGLLAHYTFEDGEPLDRSGNGYHGVTHGDPSRATACTSLRCYHLVAGISAGQVHNHEGQQILRSTTALEANHWSHLACTFSQSYALGFDGGNDYLDCGHGFVLDILDDLTLELFIQVPQVSRTHGLLSKGRLGQTNQSVPYQLALERGGRLCFTFEDGDGKRHDCRSTQSLSAGAFHRIAVTRKKGMTQSEKKGIKDFEFTDAEGNIQTQQLEMIESLDIEEWVDITFYIDGEAAGTSRYTGQTPSGNDDNLEIGRISTPGGQTAYTEGTISEVRLWRTARKANQIATAIEGNEQGLISWWRFEEQQGNVAMDSKGDNHAKIQGAQRVRNPDPVGSQLEMYINGIPVSTQLVGDTETWQQQGWGEPQFSLGGMLQKGAGQVLFNGMLEEIRIWRIVRTREQLLDNLFGRLKGEKQDLIAYYTFDESSTANQADKLYDNGLGGCHIDLPTGDQKPAAMLSTAPISNDASIVRSALSGLETTFQSTVDSTPSVQEYGDMQRDRDGNTTGVMKRCYSYLHKGRWYLYTGYKVGNLVAEWIGQAQFDPQVIGYVEGVAPLPSENLTDGAMSSQYENYAFVETLSNLEIVESESVNYTVSSSTEGSIDASFDSGLSKGFEIGSSILTAPFGFGVSTPIVEAEINVGISRHAEGSAGWDNEQSFGTSINRTRNLSVALGGSWESPEQDKQLNPAVGRRLLPGNMGFALVQSETADIFAMRLAHNNALVSFRMQPNPDIPKDWNLIPFPINPRYVKQGTLDGRIGYDAQGSVVLDPDYPNVVGYGEYSYFKPREAYALKRRIQREEQQLRHYYETIANEVETNVQANQSVGAVSGAAFQAMSSFDPSLGKAMEDLASSNQAGSQPTELPQKFAKRNLVNTYVWTADGGMFAETTETTDVRTESTSSSFSLNSSTNASVEAELSFFGVGLNLEFEASMSGGYSTSRSSDKESEKSFSIEVVVDPPGDLQVYQPKPGGGMQRLYDDDGNPVSAAGKVDAYRFMTFYLDSDKNNFEDLYNKVVDPIWLAESDHPNAIALRQANQAAKKPACWRLLHRVTFVSRLLPDFANSVEPSLPVAMKAENIDSNWQLIQKLEPFVRDKTGDAVAFADAVREALNRYLPELIPHSTEIIQYLKLYYGMTE